jgi:hypothetical protein
MPLSGCPSTRNLVRGVTSTMTAALHVLMDPLVGPDASQATLSGTNTQTNLYGVVRL